MSAKNIIKTLKQNPEILNIAKDFIGSSRDLVSSVDIDTASQSYIKYTFITVIILFIISLTFILIDSLLIDDETKEKIRYAQYVIFGTTGVLPMIVIIILGYVIISSFTVFSDLASKGLDLATKLV